MLSGMLIGGSHTLKATIVLTDDFETGAVNANSPGAPINGLWTTPSIAGWTLGGTQEVTGTDAFSSPDGIYKNPHSGHITAAFFSSNNGAVSTASIARDITTTNAPGITYNLHFWISNPIADINARQNLFSLTWDNALLNLSTYDSRFKTPNPNPLANELPGGPNEFVLDPNTDWFEVSISGLTASGSSTPLKFTAQNNNAATLLDDVTVEQTPEPSTVVLLGAAAAFMGMRRKRRTVS